MRDNGGGRDTAKRLGRNTPTPPPSEARLIVAACDECRCRCRCHQPPRPDPPPIETPPQPGDPYWSAYVAVLSAKVGSLEGAYALLNRGTGTSAA